VAEGLPGFTHHTHARSRLFAHALSQQKEKALPTSFSAKCEMSIFSFDHAPDMDYSYPV
jgi:hypothetical protein